MKRWTRFMGAAALLAFAAGCPAAAQLDHQFDEAHLTQVPEDELEPVYEVRRDIDRAAMELERAESALSQAETDVERAENFVERAELVVEAAETNFEAAQQTLDPERIEAARQPVFEANQELRVEEARLAYAESLRDWRQAEVEHREAFLLAEEARGEWVEARVVAAQGLRAPGPTVAEFEEQYRDLVLEARRELGEVEEAREVAEARRASWRRIAEAGED